MNKNEEMITHAVYECLICKHSERVKGKREDYSEVIVCPKCNGAFVDTWKINKYKSNDTNSELCEELMKYGLLTINEVRECHGLKPISEGDVLFKPCQANH